MSEICGSPVELLKRTIRGVVGWLKCGALERDAAVAVGVKVPVRRRPCAWLAREPGWMPKAEWRALRRSLLSSSCLGSVGRGIFACLRRGSVSMYVALVRSLGRGRGANKTWGWGIVIVRDKDEVNPDFAHIYISSSSLFPTKPLL